VFTVAKVAFPSTYLGRRHVVSVSAVGRGWAAEGRWRLPGEGCANTGGPGRGRAGESESERTLYSYEYSYVEADVICTRTAAPACDMPLHPRRL
jgi:hypothetical protein